MARRRGHNEGTISQRKDGRWEAKITVGYSGGKQVRKCFYGRTRQEVAAKLNDAIALSSRGVQLPNEKQTLGSFLENWLDTTAEQRLRTRTHVRYRELMRLHVLPDLGKTPLAKLTPDQLQRQFQKLQSSKGLAPRTVQQIRAILRTALNQALRHGMVTRNVAALTDPPRVERYNPAFLTYEQAEQLLIAVKGHPLECFVTVALATGMRVGEMLGLSWADVDLEAGQISVVRQQQNVKGQTLLVDLKTKRSRRVIELPDLATRALKGHKARQLALASDAKWIVSSRVFTNERGGPLDSSNLLHQFQRLLADVGLPKMRLHDLRHSCASFLLNRGATPLAVMHLLGHTTIATTMNVYGHALPDGLKGAAKLMDEVLGCQEPAILQDFS